MAVSNGPNLVLMEDALDGDVHGNDMRKFMRWMDSLVQGSVISATVTAQPASPANGDTYIVPTGATGAAWASQVGRVARWTTRITTPAWEFLVPKEGWSFRARDTDRWWEYSGTTWKEPTPRTGVATLVAGTVTVADTSITANTRIFLTPQSPGGTPGWVRVSARVASTSFTITSSDAADTSVVAYMLIEP